MIWRCHKGKVYLKYGVTILPSYTVFFIVAGSEFILLYLSLHAKSGAAILDISTNNIIPHSFMLKFYSIIMFY